MRFGTLLCLVHSDKAIEPGKIKGEVGVGSRLGGRVDRLHDRLFLCLFLFSNAKS